MGRRSGGMTGMASSTMPIGFERPSTKFETTFRRLIALRRRVPLPFSIWSRSDAASASTS